MSLAWTGSELTRWGSEAGFYLQAFQGQTSRLLELEVCLGQHFTVVEQGLKQREGHRL